MPDDSVQPVNPFDLGGGSGGGGNSDDKKEEKVEKEPKKEDSPVVEVVDNSFAPKGFPGSVKSENEKPVRPKVQPVVQEESVWDVLEQAGITKGRLLTFVILFALIVVAVLFFIFRDPTPAEPVEPVDDVEVVDSSSGSGSENFLLIQQMIAENLQTLDDLGLEFVAPDSAVGGVVVPNSLKTEIEVEDFASHMEILRGMQNIYDTDVYALLDLSVDRRTAIDQHLANMNQLILSSETGLEEVTAILQSLELEFNAAVEARDAFELEFFDDAQALRGQEAHDSLNSFIVASQEAVQVQADFNSYRIIRDMYVNSLAALRPRYQDILVNKEAVIEGIRVFDVPNSEIDAIIRLAE